MTVLREGKVICNGAAQAYLNLYLGGEYLYSYYTASPPLDWKIQRVAGKDPTGEYWVKITYRNTGLGFGGYQCDEIKLARVFRAAFDGEYNRIRGGIIGIVLTQESWEREKTYKLKIQRSDGRIFNRSLVDNYYGNRNLVPQEDCSYSRISAAFPGSVEIADIKTITGAPVLELVVKDDREQVFTKEIPDIVSVNSRCVFQQQQCPLGTCACDCHPSYICCYGKDGKAKTIITK